MSTWLALNVPNVSLLFSLTWPDCIQQMFCLSAAGHSTAPNTCTFWHTPWTCHILDTVWGPWCRKEAAWGPKSSMVVGWLHNLIAWIVSFSFFVVKFQHWSFFLGLILRRPHSPNTHWSWHNSKAPGTQCEWPKAHITDHLDINDVSTKIHSYDTQELIYKT